MQEANGKYEAVLKCRQPLRDRYSQLSQRRVELEAKYSTCTELHGNVKADGKDKIKLNVGGVRIVAARSTLTVFPDSNWPGCSVVGGTRSCSETKRADFF